MGVGVGEVGEADGEEEEGLRPAHPDGRRHAQAELLEDLADEAREEAYGEEDGEEAKGGRGHGGAHLARPLEYCLLEAKPHAAVAVNVFRHHDGVVHHDAHRHGEGEEADEVVGEAQNAEEEDGPGEGDGDGQDDGEDGVELPQEDEDHQGDGQGGQERLPHRVLHRGLDEAGGVQGDLRPVPGGGRSPPGPASPPGPRPRRWRPAS